MAEQKHTPGPWRAMLLAKQPPFVKTEGTFEIWTDEYTVCADNPDGGPIRKVADACLIAAAPELLESLIELSQLEYNMCKFIRGDAWENMTLEEIEARNATIDKVQAAIKKARGNDSP